MDGTIPDPDKYNNWQLWAKDVKRLLERELSKESFLVAQPISAAALPSAEQEGLIAFCVDAGKVLVYSAEGAWKKASDDSVVS